MAAGKKLTQAEAEQRFADAGYVLKSEYVRNLSKVDVWCSKHQQTHSVYPSNIFKGQRLWCCGNEGRSDRHTGKVVSAETRMKLSKYAGSRHHGFGKTTPVEVRKRVSAGLRAAAQASVDYAIRKASTGKTAGKSGRFYIAMAGNGLLKFGSLVRTPTVNRMGQIRQKTGASKLLLLVHVDDAGAYEAAMMNHCREHWAHGEFFRESLIPALGLDDRS